MYGIVLPREELILEQHLEYSSSNTREVTLANRHRSNKYSKSLHFATEYGLGLKDDPEKEQETLNQPSFMQKWNNFQNQDIISVTGTSYQSLDGTS